MLPDNAFETSLALFATLPAWLIAIVQPGVIRETLAQAIPEFASGRHTLRQCEIGRVRMKKDRWVGLYRLTMAAPAGGATSATPGHALPAGPAGAGGRGTHTGTRRRRMALLCARVTAVARACTPEAASPPSRS